MQGEYWISGDPISSHSFTSNKQVSLGKLLKLWVCPLYGLGWGRRVINWLSVLFSFLVLGEKRPLWFYSNIPTEKAGERKKVRIFLDIILNFKSYECFDQDAISLKVVFEIKRINPHELYVVLSSFTSFSVLPTGVKIHYILWKVWGEGEVGRLAKSFAADWEEGVTKECCISPIKIASITFTRNSIWDWKRINVQ